MRHNYKEAILASNSDVSEILIDRSVRVPLLLQQIFRDYRFQVHSGDYKYVISKPRLLTIFKSVIQYLFSKGPTQPDCLCAQVNLFNYSLLNKLSTTNQFDVYVSPQPVGHRLLGAKYLALIIAVTKLLQIRRLRMILAFRKANIPPLLYVIYLQQIVQVLLLKKLYNRIIYFSNGSPGYGRFISSQFMEIQHGVLHWDHPIINPIARVRGKFICKEVFSITPLPFMIHESDFLEREKQQQGNIVAFLPLKSEKEVLQFVKQTCGCNKFFFHPRSSMEKSEVSVSQRYEAIVNADTVISGLGTTIYDIWYINRQALKVVLTATDMHDLNACTIIEATNKLNALYSVSLDSNEVYLVTS